ncbi:MAG: sugar ABC transporter substrate-binding protein [Lachnospiraceae bacterium]|nr:sugar ABC transporter substrate-binding protein [Lachnospiraceae bacterium]
MKKKVIGFLLTVVMATSLLVGCGDNGATNETVNDGAAEESVEEPADTDEPVVEEPADTDEPLVVRIGWTPPDITGVWATVSQFMDDAVQDAAQHGITIEIVERAPTDHTGIAEQIATIENFIQQDVDVIIVGPTDVDGITPALREVNEAGIPLVMVNMMSDIEGVEVASFVGFDNFLAASVSGWTAVDVLGAPGVLGAGEEVDVPVDTNLNLEWWEDFYADLDRDSVSGRVAIIEGLAGDYFSNARVNGFLEVVDQFPNIEILTTLPGDWNRQVSVDVTENILQNFDDVDLIFAPSSEMAFGAAIGIANAGLEGEVAVIGQGGTTESGEAIRDGRFIAEIWHGFPDWGWYSMQFAVMLSLGQEVPQRFDIGPRTQTYANADNFFPTPALSPIDWETILANR